MTKHITASRWDGNAEIWLTSQIHAEKKGCKWPKNTQKKMENAQVNSENA